jgi:WD40 repeat protein
MPGMKTAGGCWAAWICSLLGIIAANGAEIVWKQGGHSWDIVDLKQSKDGTKLFSASADVTVREWAMPEGKFVRTYYGHTNIIRALEVRADGSLVASGADGGEVIVWDTATGGVKWQTQAHLYVGALAFSPDGKILATAGGSNTDPTIKLWSADTGEALGTLQGHTSWVTALIFRPDGKTLVSASVDRTIRIWDVESRTQIDMLSPGRGFIRVAFSPDPSELAIASTNLVRYGVGDGWPVLPRVGTGLRNIMDVTYSDDGSMLATASTDRKIRWWRKDTAELLHEVTAAGQSTDPGQESVLFSSNGQTIYAAGGNYAITEWEVETGNFRRQVNAITGGVVDMEFFSNDEKLALVDQARIKILKADTGDVLMDLIETNANSVAVLPGGLQMLTSGADKIVALRDTTTGDIINKTTSFVSSGMRAITLSPDAKQFVGVRGGSSFELWDAATLQLIRNFSTTSEVNIAVFLPDGGTVVSGDNVGYVRWWRLSDGAQTNYVRAHPSWIAGLALSPDGKLLATSGQPTGEKLKIWDSRSGAFVKEFAPPADTGRICFSPDGKMIAASLTPGYTSDFYLTGELRVWDLATGEIVMSHTNEAVRIGNLTWSQKNLIVFGTGNGALIAVRAPTQTSEPIQFSAALNGGRLEFLVTAAAGASVSIESSSNLNDWEPLSQITGTGAPIKFDPPSGDAGARFFRARAP